MTDPFLNPSLLIVDDDEAFRERLARAFRERGYAVTTASSASAALAEAATQRLTHATVDLRMPNSSGLMLIPELLASTPDLRIVVLTGYGSIATAVEAVRLGASDYLTKPIEIDRIEKALFDTQRASLPAPTPPSLERMEWEHINRVMSECDGNVSRAAKVLGLHRRSLQRKLIKAPGRLN